MSETLLGSGDAPAPQGDNPAPSGDNPAATPPADPPAQPPAQPPTQPAAADWTAKFQGEDLGWIQNRGLQGKTAEEAIENLAKGLRHAETRLGLPADRILKLPPDRNAEGAMDDVYKALGRPDDPVGYGFEAEKGDDLAASFNDTLSKAFHGAGLNKEQAKAVYDSVQEFITTTATAEQETEQEARTVEMQELIEEWGGKDQFDTNVVIAKEAVKALGATEDEIKALESAFGEKGSATVIKFFNRIGQKRGGEAPFIGGEGAYDGLGATTPEAARAKMQEMKADPEFVKHINSGHEEHASVKRFRKLAALAAKGR